MCQPHYARQWRTGSPLPPEPAATPGEVWLPVVGHEGRYEVSDMGRVRRVAYARGARVGRVMRGIPNVSGYLALGLSNNGKRSMATIHRLVAEAFLGPGQEGMEIRHLDNNKTNNTPGNLAWGTRQENVDDRTASGGYWWRGEKHRSARLTEEQVREIRRLAGRVPYRVLAARFGVAEVTAQQAGSGRTWKHLA